MHIFSFFSFFFLFISYSLDFMVRFILLSLPFFCVVSCFCTLPYFVLFIRFVLLVRSVVSSFVRYESLVWLGNTQNAVEWSGCGNDSRLWCDGRHTANNRIFFPFLFFFFHYRQCVWLWQRPNDESKYETLLLLSSVHRANGWEKERVSECFFFFVLSVVWLRFINVVR